MSKNFISIAVLLLAFTAEAFAWGGKGHQAVAYVAQDHLNAKAQAAMNKYLEGRTMVECASDADTYRSMWLRDFGCDITNPMDFRFTSWTNFDFTLPTHIEPWTHSYAINEETGECFRSDLMKEGSTYTGLNNCVLYIDRFSKEIQAGVDKMRPDSLMIKLCLMIHWFGDMHCPMHIQYYPTDMSKSGNMYYKGTKYSLHTFWDSNIFSLAFSGKSARTIATEAQDFESYDYSSITSGDIWNWGVACATQAREGRMVDGVRIADYSTVPDDFPTRVRLVCLRQIRDGGLRLAALFNLLFGQ